MKHLILGAGPAGVVAAESLRKLDAAASVTLIGDEPGPPYSRMAIPYWLIGRIEEDGTQLRKQADYFASRRIESITGRAQSVDAAAHQVTLQDGSIHAYDKLLVATGSRPLTPPIVGIDHPQVSSCWTLADARKIIASLPKRGESSTVSVALIGAGFIGCIILEALVASGAKLTVIEMGERMVPRMLDQTCGGLLQKWCEQKGVAVLTSSVVAAIEDDGGRLKLQIKDGPQVTADLVISATGVRANADCLEGSGVELKDGAVVVDEFMASSKADIHAAGDVACGKDFSTGDYSVQAIQPTAVEHARIAAHNMHRLGAIKHQGAVAMNVLDTIGLVSVSYGLWQGVADGDSSQLLDERGFRYIQLRFHGDRLVGANTLGMTQHIGVIRGLIQGRFRLGKWKDRLMENPLQLMEAYLATTQG